MLKKKKKEGFILGNQNILEYNENKEKFWYLEMRMLWL